MATELASRVLPLADSDREPPQSKPQRTSNSRSSPDADNLLFLHVRKDRVSHVKTTALYSLIVSYTGIRVSSCSLCPPSTECCRLQKQERKKQIRATEQWFKVFRVQTAPCRTWRIELWCPTDKTFSMLWYAWTSLILLLQCNHLFFCSGALLTVRRTNHKTILQIVLQKRSAHRGLDHKLHKYSVILRVGNI